MGVVSLALFTAALITFPAFPTTGAALPPSTHAFTVDRTLKGDRLTPPRPVLVERPALDAPAVGENTSPPRPRARVPLGCDAAFSPISSPLLAGVFRRCAV
jgi:hypothetical protein